MSESRHKSLFRSTHHLVTETDPSAHVCMSMHMQWLRALCLSTRGMYDMYVGAAASLHSFDSGCIYVTLT